MAKFSNSQEIRKEDLLLIIKGLNLLENCFLSTYCFEERGETLERLNKLRENCLLELQDRLTIPY